MNLSGLLGQRTWRRDFSSARLLLWGAAILVAGALLLPPLYLLIRALESGVETWRALVFSPSLWRILFNTLFLAVATTALATAIAIPLAWLTSRTDLPARRLLSVLTPLPLVIPSFVGAYLIVSALGPRGLLQKVLEVSFGVERLPPLYGFPGALITLTLLSYPYILLNARAAFQHMDPALEEASRSLGRNSWQTFFSVTLPHLRPALGAGALFVALYALRDFGAVSIMRYDTFTRAIYIQYRSFDRSQAAVLSLVLVAITLIFVIFEGRTRSRARLYRSDSGARKPPKLVRLGKWRWPAFAFTAGVVFFALVLPSLVLGYWVWRGLVVGQALQPLGQAVGNSVLVAVLAAVLITIAALPVAIISVRYRSRIAHSLERMTYAAFALPGIVVALALVFFGSRYALVFYQTIPMLLLAYLVLFIPEAVGNIRSSLLKVPPNLVEAARGLGRSPVQVLSRVILPLIRPGVATGAALVLLTTMKELPATLILAPIGFTTLSTSVWNAISEAFFAQAALPALLLVLTSSIPTAILMLREK